MSDNRSIRQREKNEEKANDNEVHSNDDNQDAFGINYQFRINNLC